MLISLDDVEPQKKKKKKKDKITSAKEHTLK